MPTFKSKMKYLEADWADRIWDGATAMNDGAGSSWRLGLAALAITGARPASLARGIVFSWACDKQGNVYLRADIPGAKIIRNPDGTPRRGQDKVLMAWRCTHTSEVPADVPERHREFVAIVEELRRLHPSFDKGGSMTLRYDADAIATGVRDLSKRLWPRKKHHVSPICYRERFSAHAKSIGVDPAELARAMGHLSAESQGRYQSAYRGKSKGKVAPRRLFTAVQASSPVKVDRAPMARFKVASAARKKAASAGLKKRV